ncbi:MAG: VWA domain-containing protein [Desulfamplus sp.]|nr:VWA domain-containing protein [Desulfamplus sp.]
MNSFANIAIQKARPLPVIILADTSGSMSEHGKIDALNTALREMVRSFGEQSRLNAEIHVGIITFGPEVVFHDIKPAYQYEKVPMFDAKGGTPLGQALALTQKIIEDGNLVPLRSYRPTIVVISDGMPTDSWEQPLLDFLTSEKASKSMRLAMGIGPDADKDMLAKFINDPAIPVIKGNDARDIEKFLKCVSTSVIQRSIKSNPNSIEKSAIVEIFEEEELEF